MGDYTDQPWYHGSIPRRVAEERLGTQFDGSFLFRCSESRPGLSLSLKTCGKIRHYIVVHEESLWHVHGKPETFLSLIDLVEHYSKQPLSRMEKQSLGTPCPKGFVENPYLALQEEEEVHCHSRTLKKNEGWSRLTQITVFE
eukprot:m.66075 g.66075  ORF g.66075 m.66075 type:complete len:142 (-) comp12096_c0_seq3:802-1227(-)